VQHDDTANSVTPITAPPTDRRDGPRSAGSLHSIAGSRCSASGKSCVFISNRRLTRLGSMRFSGQRARGRDGRLLAPRRRASGASTFAMPCSSSRAQPAPAANARRRPPDSPPRVETVNKESRDRIRRGTLSGISRQTSGGQPRPRSCVKPRLLISRPHREPPGARRCNVRCNLPRRSS